jgi:small-conductance mechanosensitive channel
MADHLTQLLEPYAQLFDVKSIEAMGLRVLGAVFIMLAGVWLSRSIQRYLLRRMEQRYPEDKDVINLYRRIVRITVLLIAAGIALHVIGFDMTHLFTTGGLLAVAAAFAMKTTAENFVSGLFIRLERSITRGDVLSMADGGMVRVERIGPRATIVRSKAGVDLIVPNSELVQNAVCNYTYRDSLYRLETQVGVAYETDLKQVQAVLEQTCNNLEWRSKHSEPVILLDAFGDSSVNYLIRVWIDDPWVAGRMRSQLNEAIWWALKDAHIVIAFPQLDVHLPQQDAPT